MVQKIIIWKFDIWEIYFWILEFVLDLIFVYCEDKKIKNMGFFRILFLKKTQERGGWKESVGNE